MSETRVRFPPFASPPRAVSLTEHKSGPLRIYDSNRFLCLCRMLIMKKSCSICGELRCVEDFNWRSRDKGVRMKYCRGCQHKFSRNHYAANKNDYLKRNERRRQRHAELIRQAKSVPCADCKHEYPFYVMEFDHVKGDKRRHVSRMATLGLKAILTEIDKCEVVCSNCHKARTWKRKNAPVA